MEDSTRSRSLDSDREAETAVRAGRCSWTTKKSGAYCFAPTSIRRNGEVAFFSHTARSAYDLEGQGGAAGH
ncbi:hypothetical protein [Pseudobacillus wudalianchiensis]|uniref:Uncharacterized protein n=1 Tax=Pseudobacillus wudalianchiensis TaxID=1743143 RepID=A0A1B9B8V1_9BACI|nr:hypothetical protein [Bacillus wudalianchiensis]OCA92510.1 hypothetical protein A8F95_02055 [Bacillus wudalianchiensis]